MADTEPVKKPADPLAAVAARLARVEKLGGIGQIGSTLTLVALLLLKPGVSQDQLDSSLRREMEPIKERLNRLELRDEMRRGEKVGPMGKPLQLTHAEPTGDAVSGELFAGNKVLASPADGSLGVMTARALTAADIAAVVAALSNNYFPGGWV